MDFSERAREVLKKTDFILSEDTRRIRKLLSCFGIKGKRILSFYSGNEKSRFRFILKELRRSKSFALVSESGTPAISDPGASLIALLHREGIRVVPLPGPTAPATAYSASGFTGSKFIFIGFLPKRRKKLISSLKIYLSLNIPVIFFESSRRIKKTLEIIREFFKNLDVFYIREISKVYEEYFRGDLIELIKYLKDRDIKGEITVIVKSF